MGPIPSRAAFPAADVLGFVLTLSLAVPQLHRFAESSG